MVAAVSLPRFAKLQVDDEVVNRVQDRVKTAVDAIQAVPLLDGRVLEVALSTTPTIVPHGLARPWQGYLVIARDANAQVWNAAPGAEAGSFLTLTASAAVNVTLWVF